MIYESVQESVAAYNKRKKEEETQEDRQVFKWKFVVIGLGIIVIILIGALSEFYKSIAETKELKYDTTFLYQMLKQSNFLDTPQTIQNFMKGLNASEDIVFDRVTVLYKNDTLNPETLIQSIQDKQSIVYLFDVNSSDSFDSFSNANTSHRFGLYLYRQFTDRYEDTDSEDIFVAQPPNRRISAVFSLEDDFSMRLNASDMCFTYKYIPSQKNLSLIQSFNIVGQTQKSINLLINQTSCLGKTQIDVMRNLQSLISMDLDRHERNRLTINKMQVIELEMKNQVIDL